MRIKRTMLALASLAFLLFCTTAHAQTGSPRELRAIVSPSSVVIEWIKAVGTDPTSYNVYLYKGQSDDPSKFKKVAEVREPRHELRNLENGAYSVYVTAIIGNSESQPSRFAFFVWNKQQEAALRFTSKAPTSAPLNKEWVYKPTVSTKDTQQVLFNLETSVSSVQFDESTGEIRFTPTANGVFRFVIIAYLANDPTVRVSQVIELRVGNSEESKFRFVSQPSKEGEAGKVWDYRARVEGAEQGAVVRYRLVAAPEGMTIDEETGVVIWTPRGNGIYRVVIEAIAEANGKTTRVQQVFEVRVGVPAEGAFRFISQPRRDACINKEYVYQAKAIAPANVAVVYSFDGEVPQGMTIDARTGVVRWTPTETGEFAVAINASIENSSKIGQRWVILVRETCENGTDKRVCAVITGAIEFEANRPVPVGNAIAIRVDSNAAKEKMNQRFVAPIIAGRFVLRVTEGTYVVYIEGREFKQYWFEGAEGIEGAKRYDLKCADTVMLRATVVAPPRPNFYVVEGMIRSEAGTALDGRVEFIAQDKTPGNESMRRIVVRSSANEGFRVEIPDNATYIARAFANGDQYLPIYFDGVDNPEEAVRVKLSANMEMNFVLKARPSYDNGLSGTVKDSAGTGVSAKVVAFMIKARNGETGKMETRSVETDEQGNYSITNLIPGDYILLAIPQGQGLVPGYYKAADYAVRNWRDADKIGVGEVMTTVQFDIMLRSHNGKRGAGRYRGIINEGPRGLVSKGDGPQGASPVAGALVLGLDDEGNVSDFGFSDTEGLALLSELVAGSTNIVVDKPGFESAQSSVTVDYRSLSVVEQSVTLNQGRATSVEPTYLDNAGLAYPNPTAAIINISVPGDGSGSASVQIMSQQGETVWTGNVTGAVIQADMSAFASGMYFARISTPNGVAVVPFAVAR